MRLWHVFCSEFEVKCDINCLFVSNQRIIVSYISEIMQNIKSDKSPTKRRGAAGVIPAEAGIQILSHHGDTEGTEKRQKYEG